MDLLKSLKMLDEETIEITFHDNIVIDLEGIQKAWLKLDEFTKNRRLKKLTIIGKNTAINKDARKHGHEGSELRKKYIIAEAMVVHTLTQKMAANFYAAFVKASYPVKYFTEIEDAKRWLSTINN